MKYILSIALLAYSLSVIADSRNYNESYYNDLVCASIGGTPEVILKDRTRVDCLTKDRAIETEWASRKAYEAVGQSLHYGKMTGKTPSILFLVKDKKDLRWVRLTQDTIRHYGLTIEIEIIWVDKERVIYDVQM